jgi:hypothetical protein
VGCWKDVEFCEFAPVSIVDQVTVFIYPVKPKPDVPVQVTIIFLLILRLMLTLYVAYVYVFIDCEVNIKFLTKEKGTKRSCKVVSYVNDVLHYIFGNRFLCQMYFLFNSCIYKTGLLVLLLETAN